MLKNPLFNREEFYNRCKRALQKDLLHINFGNDYFGLHDNSLLSHTDNYDIHNETVLQHFVNRETWVKFLLSMPETGLVYYPNCTPSKPPRLELEDVMNPIHDRFKNVQIHEFKELDDDYFEYGLSKLLEMIESGDKVSAENYGDFFNMENDESLIIDQVGHTTINDYCIKVINNTLKLLDHTIGSAGFQQIENFHSDDAKYSGTIRKILWNDYFTYKVPTHVHIAENGCDSILLNVARFGLQDVINEILNSESFCSQSQEFETLMKEVVCYMITAQTTRCILTDYVTSIYIEIGVVDGEYCSDNDHAFIDLIRYKVVSSTSSGLTLRSLLAWYFFTAGYQTFNNHRDAEIRMLDNLANRFLMKPSNYTVQYNKKLETLFQFTPSLRKHFKGKRQRIMADLASFEKINNGPDCLFEAFKVPTSIFNLKVDPVPIKTPFVLVKIFNPLYLKGKLVHGDSHSRKIAAEQLFLDEVVAASAISKHKKAAKPRNSYETTISSNPILSCGYICLTGSYNRIQHFGLFLATQYDEDATVATSRKDILKGMKQLKVFYSKLKRGAKGDSNVQPRIMINAKGEVFLSDFQREWERTINLEQSSSIIGEQEPNRATLVKMMENFQPYS